MIFCQIGVYLYFLGGGSFFNEGLLTEYEVIVWKLLAQN